MLAHFYTLNNYIIYTNLKNYSAPIGGAGDYLVLQFTNSANNFINSGRIIDLFDKRIKF